MTTWTIGLDMARRDRTDAVDLNKFDHRVIHTHEEWAWWLALKVCPTYGTSYEGETYTYVRRGNAERVEHVLTKAFMRQFFTTIGTGLRKKPNSTKGRKRWKREQDAKARGVHSIEWMLLPNTNLQHLFDSVLVSLVA